MQYQQISKQKAQKLFNEGKEVYLHPSKMLVYNAWQPPIGFTKSENNDCFQSLVNQYRYYNCCKERGLGILFFMPSV